MRSHRQIMKCSSSSDGTLFYSPIFETQQFSSILAIIDNRGNPAGGAGGGGAWLIPGLYSGAAQSVLNGIRLPPFGINGMNLPADTVVYASWGPIGRGQGSTNNYWPIAAPLPDTLVVAVIPAAGSIIRIIVEGDEVDDLSMNYEPGQRSRA
jgi:hypothetical protein